MHTRRWGRGEDGQMLVIFALCLVAIVAMTGLVIDGGMTFVQKREQQNVADAAALAAAYAYVNSGNEADAAPAARAAATANGYTAGTDGVTVSVSTSIVGGAIRATVSVTKPHRNYFSGIVGFSSWPVTTTASSTGGTPNAALGAMPVIFNQKAFPVAVGPENELSFTEPGTGNEDVPQTATQFNWTVFCEANGNPCNSNTDLVNDYIRDRGVTTWVTIDEQIGPLNAGEHAALFSDLSDVVGTKNNEFPVSIVDDDGNMRGWAMFHLTGSVGGSTKEIRGYFLAEVNRGDLEVRQGVDRGGAFGDTPVRLTN